MLALSGKALYPLFSITSKRVSYLGPFGTTATINIVCILAMFILFTSKHTFINRKNASFLYFFIILIILSLYSYFNPYNVYRSSFIPPLIYFLQILFFLYAIKISFSDKEIFKSLYSAISIWVCFQLLLTICYPILNIQSVLTLFHEGSEFWAERREGYHSATGTFIHPAGLAYTISLYVLFYIASYFSNYSQRNKVTLIGPLECVATLNKEGTSLTFDPPHWEVKVRANFTRFLPTIFRAVSVVPTVEEEKLPIGFKKIFPADGNGNKFNKVRYL